jgi:small neutral amino acid transporter SnatA (MarC family)
MNNPFVILFVSVPVFAGLLSSYKLYHDRKLTLKRLILNTAISTAFAVLGIYLLLR